MNSIQMYRQAFSFSIFKTIPEILIFMIGTIIIDINFVWKVMIIIVGVTWLLLKNMRVYIDVSRKLKVMDDIRADGDCEGRIKGIIEDLECTKEVILKKHELYRSFSPVSIVSLILTLLVKKYPEYSTVSIDYFLNNMLYKADLANLVIGINTVGDIILIFFMLIFLFCLYETFNTFFRYRIIIGDIMFYKNELNKLFIKDDKYTSKLKIRKIDG